MFDVGRSAGALDPGRSGGRVGASVGATGATAEASAAGSTPDHLGGADDSAARHCAAVVAYLAELRGAALSSCNVCASAHPTRRSWLGRSALVPQWPRPVGGRCLGVWGDIGRACPPQNAARRSGAVGAHAGRSGGPSRWRRGGSPVDTAGLRRLERRGSPEESARSCRLERRGSAVEAARPSVSAEGRLDEGGVSVGRGSTASAAEAA